MKHYLVTGGAGFIGSNLIQALFRKEPGIRITCIDNFDPFYSTDIKEMNIAGFLNQPGFSLVRMDLADAGPAAIKAAVPEKVDAIIHLAAKAGVRPSIENPLAYQRSNVIGLQHLLDYAVQEKIKQFVFASSSSVYGVNDHFPWKEDEQLMPISPYAMTKLSGEMLGHVYHKLYGIRFIALRFFTVYGPGQRPDLAIHNFTKSMVQGKPIPVFGDGSTSRDYTYVDDTVKGVMAAVDYTGSDFEIINLGNRYAVTLNDLISALESVTGLKAVKNMLPAQPGDVPKTFADISRAAALLDYHPQTTLRDGLSRFYEWFNLQRELLLK